jgi:hypothetical protein
VIAGLVSAGLVMAAWTMRGDATPFTLLLPRRRWTGGWRASPASSAAVVDNRTYWAQYA